MILEVGYTNKTMSQINWKYILIVVVLSTIVGGGILWCATKQITKPSIIDLSIDLEGPTEKEIDFMLYCGDGLMDFEKTNPEFYQNILKDFKDIFGIQINIPNCDLDYLQVGYIDIDGDNEQEIIVELEDKDAYSSFHLIIYKQEDKGLVPVLIQEGYHLKKIYLNNDQLVVKLALYEDHNRSYLIFPPKYQYVYYKFIDDKLEVDEIVEESISLEEIAEDPEFCKEFIEFSKKRKCFQALLETGDSSLCADFKSNGDRDECYWNFARYKEDQSLCKKVLSLPNKNACYIHLALSLKDPSLCEKIDNSEVIPYDKKPLNLKSKAACRIVSKEDLPWKLYQNEKDGYEIQCPSNFLINQFSENLISFTSPKSVIKRINPYSPCSPWSKICYGGFSVGNAGSHAKVYGDLIWISAEEIELEEKLEEWIRKRFGLEEFREFTKEKKSYYSEVYSIEKIVIGEDIHGYEVVTTYKAYEHIYRFIKHNDVVISIEGNVFSEPGYAAPLIYQMLSTFRFLK